MGIIGFQRQTLSEEERVAHVLFRLYCDLDKSGGVGAVGAVGGVGGLGAECTMAGLRSAATELHHFGNI
jgi:hypothetical protein